MSLKQLITLLIVFPYKSNMGGSHKPYLFPSVIIYISNY